MYYPSCTPAHSSPYKLHLSGLIVIVLFVAILISSFNPRWLVVIISPYPDFKGLFFRLMFLCGSSILCYLILIVCKFKRDWSRNILAKVGSETLFFYLLHPYVLYVIVAIWSQMNDHINMLSAICITSVTVFILMLLRKIKPIYKFLR